MPSIRVYSTKLLSATAYYYVKVHDHEARRKSVLNIIEYHIPTSGAYYADSELLSIKLHKRLKKICMIHLYDQADMVEHFSFTITSLAPTSVTSTALAVSGKCHI